MIKIAIYIFINNKWQEMSKEYYWINIIFLRWEIG